MNCIDHWTGRDPLITPCISPHAPDTCSPELFGEVAGIAAARGLSLHTHLHQSPGEVAAVLARDGRRPVETLEEIGALSPRLVAGHCIHMTPQDIARFGRSGAAVAHVPVGNAAHGSVAPILALQAAGARIGLATDTKSGDLFEAMRLALAGTRIRAAWEAGPRPLPGGFAAKSADVLGWATLGGAAALGLAGEIGVIAPGAQADLVLLDGSAPNLAPLIDAPGTVVHGAQGGNVDIVMVAGRVVLEGGRPTLFDGAEVVAAAQAVAARLWRRAGQTPAAA
jgi:5-methylthioadenosine/S-adenosylhomocysteine deaminase